jgi:hypothetical protein
MGSVDQGRERRRINRHRNDGVDALINPGRDFRQLLRKIAAPGIAMHERNAIKLVGTQISIGTNGLHHEELGDRVTERNHIPPIFIAACHHPFLMSVWGQSAPAQAICARHG